MGKTLHINISWGGWLHTKYWKDYTGKKYTLMSHRWNLCFGMEKTKLSWRWGEHSPGFREPAQVYLKAANYFLFLARYLLSAEALDGFEGGYHSHSDRDRSVYLLRHFWWVKGAGPGNRSDMPDRNYGCESLHLHFLFRSLIHQDSFSLLTALDVCVVADFRVATSPRRLFLFLSD